MAEKKIVDLVVNDNLQETEGHLKDLTGQIKTSKKEVQSFADSFDELNQSATNVDATFEEVYGDLKPLTARMGEAEDRLYELSLAGKQGTKEFQALLTTVGNYRKTQIQTDLAVDSAATTMTQKLGGSLEYVSGAFAATQGALAIFGKENKSVEQAILKVQSALAITQGFAAMREGANSVKQLGTAIKSLTVFQTAYNFINNATSIGLKVLRGALISTGIGALVVGVGLLVANFDKLKSIALKLVPQLATVGKVIGGIVNYITDFVGVTSEAGRATERMLEKADKAIKKNEKFLAENASKLDEYTKRKIDANTKYNEALKKDGADQVALAKEYNRELAKIDKERANADAAKAKGIKDANKKESDEEKARIDAYNKSIVDATKAYYNEIADIEADTEQKKLDLWKKRQIEEINLIAKNRKDRDTLLLALQADYNLKSSLLDKKAREEGEIARDEYEKLVKEKQDKAKTDLETARREGEESRIAYEKDLRDKEKAILDARISAQWQFVDALQGAFNALGSLFEQGSAEAKAFALIDIAIGTAKGFVQGLDIAQKSAAAAGPGAAFAFPIFYATQVAAVLSAAGRAKSVLESGNSSSGGAGSSAPTAPPASPRFNVVGTSGANQIAQTLGGGLPPVKAYVVANDVTSAQSLNRNIVSSASLG